MTVPMALMDFVPVLLFGAAWVILYRDLRNKLNLFDRVLLPLGAVMVFAAGFFKAIWKMQTALGLNAVELFNKAMFPTQSTGFVLLGIGMLAFLFSKRKATAHSLTMVFVMGNVLGALGMLSGLVYVAKKMKVNAAVPLFILTFVLLMMMGYLSSGNFAQAYMNWVAQGVNTLSQGLMFIGALLLHRAGLADADALTRAA